MVATDLPDLTARLAAYRRHIETLPAGKQRIVFAAITAARRGAAAALARLEGDARIFAEAALVVGAIEAALPYLSDLAPLVPAGSV